MQNHSYLGCYRNERKRYWIGLRYENEHNQWRWLNGEQAPNNSTFWSTTPALHEPGSIEPNNTCAYLFLDDFKIYADKCSRELMSLCKIN